MKFNGNTPTVFATFATVGVADNEVGHFGWSSKNIIDRLCPAFTESGDVVTCNPVEGYPLDVVSEIAVRPDEVTELKLTHCGKNLIPNQYVQGQILGVNGDTVIMYPFDGFCCVWDVPLQPGTYTLSGPTTAYMVVYDEARTCNWAIGGIGGVSLPRTFTISEPAYFGLHCELAYENMFQLEYGSVATAFEPYNGQTYTVPLDDGFVFDEDANAVYRWKHGIFNDTWGEMYWYNATTQQWEYLGIEGDVDVSGYKGQHDILALPGVNTLFSNTGDTTVTGRKDLVKVIEDLTNAIVAMGDNV